MTRLRADGLLLLTAAIWGTAFVAQKSGNKSMGPILFVGARFLCSALIVLPLALREARNQTAALSRRDLVMAGVIGLCLFVGSSLQQVALLTTTATNGGFLTALYVVLVPVTTWLLTRKSVRPAVIVACVISLVGAWLLSGGGALHVFARGDVLLLISDGAWAFAISLIGVFLDRAPRPMFLALAQYSVTAALGIAAGLAFEPTTLAGVEEALPAILYAGVISGGIAFTLQIVAQRHTPAPEAALIMSLESVAAAVAGALLLGERLSMAGMTGCGLILLGVVVAEAGPTLRRLS